MQKSNSNELLIQKNFECEKAGGATKIQLNVEQKKLGAGNKYATKRAIAAQLNSVMRCIKARIAKG